MNSLKKLIGLSIIFIPCAVIAETTVYKWMDADGVVHFGAAPPPDQQADTLQLRKSDTPPPSTANNGATNNGQKKQDAAATTLEMQVKQKNCDTSRNNLKIYQDSSHIKQADGSLKEITEQERANKLKEMEANIHKYCNK